MQKLEGAVAEWYNLRKHPSGAFRPQAVWTESNAAVSKESPERISERVCTRVRLEGKKSRKECGRFEKLRLLTSLEPRPLQTSDNFALLPIESQSLGSLRSDFRYQKTPLSPLFWPSRQLKLMIPFHLSWSDPKIQPLFRRLYSPFRPRYTHPGRKQIPIGSGQHRNNNHREGDDYSCGHVMFCSPNDQTERLAVSGSLATQSI
jgi:hypothetical protein